MFSLSAILNEPVFGLRREAKDDLFVKAMGDLTGKHYAGCAEYKKILDILGYKLDNIAHPKDIPFLPVRLFKEYELLSVPRQEIIKTMTSSGTTGQQVSRIYLDRETSINQTKVLAKIVTSFLGRQRFPMLIVDTQAVIKDRELFSARGAGIVGFSMLGRDHFYALNDNMEPDMDGIRAYLDRHREDSVMIFGFTYMLWEHFFSELKKRGDKLNVKDGVVVHGGGWKKLIEKAVDNESFKKTAEELCGIQRVHNYYGMVEQTGSIFMECENGYLHAPLFSDVIVRDPTSFRSMEPGEQGLLQLLSLLPGSYPGHSILSEDLGELVGVDDCECGRLGKYFLVHGRIKNAEVRGCSDTYAANRE